MIKRLSYISGFIILFLLLSNHNSNAQIETDAAHTTQTSYTPSDPIFIFENLQLNPSLRYSDSDPSVNYQFEWFRHNPETNSWDQLLQTQFGHSTALIANQPGGYLLRIDKGAGDEEILRCWIFETHILNPEIIIDLQDCFSLKLTATSESIPLTYYHPVTGNPGTVNIEKTYQWSASPALELSQDGASIEMEAPFEDTQFMVTITDAGNKTATAQLDYTAIAVKADYDWEVIKPDVEHEIHQGDESSIIQGSAPIEIRLQENSSGPVTRWAWEIVSSSGIFDLTGRNPFYVFHREDQYEIFLTVYNNNVFVDTISVCSHRTTDPKTVTVMESLLEVPNTFTPDGDGINDEFRVAYRSLRKFNMVIYNRWGRRVYSSSNPAEGWDGTIGGKQAAPGVYFYHIEAEGYQSNEKHKLSGPIHLIRGR